MVWTKFYQSDLLCMKSLGTPTCPYFSWIILLLILATHQTYEYLHFPEQAELAKHCAERPKIQQQFADLK